PSPASACWSPPCAAEPPSDLDPRGTGGETGATPPDPRRLPATPLPSVLLIERSFRSRAGRRRSGAPAPDDETGGARMLQGLGSSTYWHETSQRVPNPAVTGRHDVDVAIVGGGYTGLWTAYHLLEADPSLRVAVIEREVIGFGASGRN